MFIELTLGDIGEIMWLNLKEAYFLFHFRKALPQSAHRHLTFFRERSIPHVFFLFFIFI